MVFMFILKVKQTLPINFFAKYFFFTFLFSSSRKLLCMIYNQLMDVSSLNEATFFFLVPKTFNRTTIFL
jgi:hypothetical protein